MKCARAAMLLLLLQFPVADAQSTESIRVVELLADPDTTASQREFIELENQGTTSVELAGWTLLDLAGNRFTFAPWSLQPGRRVVVWGGGAGDGLGPAWSSASAWNNAGDTVTLSDPTGTVVDWFSYGAERNAVPPNGFTSEGHPPAPARGQSMTFATTWGSAAPSPGFAPGAQGGAVGAEVENQAPTASFTGLPASVAPATDLNVAFLVEDANGDVPRWTLYSNGEQAATGTGLGTTSRILKSPAAGPWTLRLTVADASASSEATALVGVAAEGLRVTMPAGGRLAFPPLEPGARNVTSTDRFTIHNDGSSPLVPRFDLSDFRGPAVLAVAGNVSVGTESAGTGMTWTRYMGPVTLLPELAAASSFNVTLRIDRVPLPLAAGSYGTSFSVVA